MHSGVLIVCWCNNDNGIIYIIPHPLAHAVPCSFSKPGLVVPLSLSHLPCCSGCPMRGLIGEADTARSSQDHLVSSNWPVWADQPTVHHSVWEDHFHSHHTPQHAFLLTIRHHRPGSGAGVLCKGSRSYTEWKWYLQQLGECDTLQRCDNMRHCMCYSKLWLTNLTFMFQHVLVLAATSFAAVGAPRDVSLVPLTSQGAITVTWSPPKDLCGLTYQQYTIQYGRTTSTPTTHPSTPSSPPFNITGLEVGQEYFVRVAVRTQIGSGTFSSWESVTTYEGVRATVLHVIFCHWHS